MSRLSDYLGDVFSARFADQDVERLLGGQTLEDPDLGELTPFVDALSSYGKVAPSNTAMEQVVARAAATARAARDHGSGLVPEAVVHRSDRRLSWPTHRFAVAIAAFLLLLGMSGIAVAANAAAPGDALYGLDRALERVGIGDGSAEERIAEADALMAVGDYDTAISHLSNSMNEAFENADIPAIEKIQRHLDLARSRSNPNASAAQQMVAEKKAFIEANKGKGMGADGNDFGQGVSDIAKSKPQSNPVSGAAGDTEPEEEAAGPPDHAGPKEGKGNAPDHAGPKDKGENEPQGKMTGQSSD